MLCKIGNFKVVSFGLGLKEVAPFSIQQSNTFLNTATERTQSMCVEQIIIKYKCIVFEVILPIYGELLPYVFWATHFIKLGN